MCIYEHNEELNSLIDENSMFRTPVYKEIASEIVGSIYSWLYGNHQDNVIFYTYLLLSYNYYI